MRLLHTLVAFLAGATIVGLAISQTSKGMASRVRPTHFVLYQQNGVEKPELWMRVDKARLAYYEKLRKEGKLLYYGQYDDIKEFDVGGEIAVLKATDTEAARIVANDPIVTNGLRQARAQKWDVRIDSSANDFQPHLNTK